MVSQLATSNIVSVQISVQDQSVSSGDFSELLFVGTSTAIPLNERVQAYTSSFDVGQVFGTASQEYVAAVTFFAQNPHPPQMLIGRWVNVDQPAVLTTDKFIVALGSITPIIDGSFNITIDGDNQDITGLDFSLAASFDDVAAVIETGLQAIGTGGYTAATVVYNSNTFIITSGTSGATSSITLPVPVSPVTGTDLTTIATLNLGAGAIVAGADQETALEALQAIQAINDTFYAFTYTNILRDDSDVLTLAAYAESLVKIYGTTSNDATVLTTGTTDIPAQLNALDYNRTIAFYHDQAQYYPEVSGLSNELTVNFLGVNTTQVLAFKPTPGIPAVEMTQTQYNNLKSKQCNSVVSISKANNPQIQQGTMASGRYLDIQHGLDWLQDYIQTNVLQVLMTQPKVPYTDAGVALLDKATKNSLQQGVTNGYLTTLIDDDGNVIPAYTTTVARVIDVPPSQRINRISPPINFTAQASNGIQNISIIGTLTI